MHVPRDGDRVERGRIATGVAGVEDPGPVNLDATGGADGAGMGG
jgi:hypothetical protein